MLVGTLVGHVMRCVKVCKETNCGDRIVSPW